VDKVLALPRAIKANGAEENENGDRVLQTFLLILKVEIFD
jgi:hypothetical protein